LLTSLRLACHACQLPFSPGASALSWIDRRRGERDGRPRTGRQQHAPAARFCLHRPRIQCTHTLRCALWWYCRPTCRRCRSERHTRCVAARGARAVGPKAGQSAREAGPRGRLAHCERRGPRRRRWAFPWILLASTDSWAVLRGASWFSCFCFGLGEAGSTGQLLLDWTGQLLLAADLIGLVNCCWTGRLVD
jgi:hypothetical protein